MPKLIHATLISLLLACQGQHEISSTASFEEDGSVNAATSPSYTIEDRIEGTMECQFVSAKGKGSKFNMVRFRENSGAVFVKLGEGVNIWPNRFVRFSAKAEQPKEQ